MVVRVLTGRWLGRDGALGPIGRAVCTDARRASGNLSATFGRQTDGAGIRFVLVTVWRSPDDIYRWVGPDLLRPRWLRPHWAETEMLDIQHYETVDDPLPTDDDAVSAEEGAAREPAGTFR